MPKRQNFCVPGTKNWLQALINKSMQWMGTCDEVEFFRKWKQLLSENRAKANVSQRRIRLENLIARRIYEKHHAKLGRERRKLDAERLEKYRKYCREKMSFRLKNDPEFKLRFRTRTRILQSLKRGVSKSGGTVELIGCTIPEYKAHIESLWKPGMTWENHGRGSDKWHIDHVRPCKDFDLSDPAQQRECFNFKNTQPLWESENLRKGAK